ncbi:MAG: SPFH domain-containing protein [Pseudomonadota bacterium]|jgi:regulator of protease activity HflC (stomatin/prohibitin superfamily)|uniref:SPFH domain-containing protein n=2 Tax=Burkholderiales TaxID=80840 RepID=UPI0020177501|nr:SPFH domain-containing protein [Burkholderia sp. 4M9327F10]
MLHQVQSDEETTRSYPVSATRIASISLTLAVLLGVLPLLRGGWFDIRWCAALSSAWLDVFTVALAARLANTGGRRAPATASQPLGWQVWRLVWWRAAGSAVIATLRAIRWQPWAVLLCAALAVAVASLAWRPPVQFALAAVLRPPGAALIAGLAAFALAFGTLVAELFFSMHAGRGRAWASLGNVLRAALLSALVAAVCAVLLAYAGFAAQWPVRAIAAFSAAIAGEFALRAVFSWFAPPQMRSGDASVPDSLVASLLRLRPSPLARFSAQLRSRYGIDLRQNWVLQSVVRLLPAALGTIAVCAWLLTGVVILGPEQRAVYERFGAPVAVWQPGLHVALPWPFGKARAVDNGAVHQLVVSGSPEESTGASPLVPADAQTPEQLNRLWDVVHEGETSQVIAGASGDRQNFQIVSADVRLDYRIGLSDAAARASLYRADDVPATVRAIANREVVRYLASHTLDSLLETRQTVMADALRRAVQAQLNRITSGIEVVAVVIESVHPPAGASAAWHSVQAAQIRAEASVAQARGQAAQSLGDAQQQAQTAVAQADAQAADITSAAQVQQTSFSADMIAAQAGGPAFVLEYYLHNLQKGLQNAHVTVIDDRLVEGNRATIDLRSYGAGDVAGARRVY